MKKKVSFALGLLSVTGFMMSCARENFNWENFKLENISDYSAIGFAAFSSEKKQIQSRKNSRQNKNEEITDIQAYTLGSLISSEKISVDVPFTLVGQINNEIVELGFKSGYSINNLQIDVFGCIGDFIFFRPLDERSEFIREFDGSTVELKQNEYILYLPFVNSNYVPNYGDDYPSYFLSRKSGKIYKYEVGTSFNFKSKGGTIYASIYATDSFEDKYLYKIIEENETLNFVPTKIPASYLYETVKCKENQKDEISPDIDKYGNFLTSMGIITPDMKIHKFSSYFDGGAFAINGEDEIVYFSDDCLTSYVLDSNGEFVESNNALRGLYFEQTGYRYNSDVQASKEDYFKEIVGILADSSSYVYLTYDKNNYIVGTNGITFENNRNYNVDKKQTIYKNEEYAYDQHMQRYLLDERGFYICDHTKDKNTGSLNETILRGSSVYYYQNSELHKFDMSTETDSVISLDYTITSLGVDEYGRITVNCLDDSFNQFVGYLEMDDTISLEAKEVPEVSNYVLYPVN